MSDNAEYQEARQQQAEVENRIMRLETILKTAEIVTPRHTSAVGVGSTVVVQKKGSKDTKTFSIVGSEESNTSKGKISDQSPLGEAMIGTKKGDSFTVKAPAGAVEYTIVEVK